MDGKDILNKWNNIPLGDVMIGAGEDLEADDVLKTPDRFLSALQEMIAGYEQDPLEIATSAVFPFEEGSPYVVVRDIDFMSICRHHLLPIIGVAHVGYKVNESVIGLSKIPRVVEAWARRLQVQEKMTEEIADTIDQAINPEGLLVVVEGRHLCCTGRGIKKTHATMVTAAERGEVDSFLRRLVCGCMSNRSSRSY